MIELHPSRWFHVWSSTNLVLFLWASVMTSACVFLMLSQATIHDDRRNLAVQGSALGSTIIEAATASHGISKREAAQLAYVLAVFIHTTNPTDAELLAHFRESVDDMLSAPENSETDP